MVAKRPEAKSNLSLQFFNKTTKRKYRALVWGIVQEDEGRIEGNIGRDPRDRMQMTVFPEGDQGKTAVTHYTVLERLGYVSLVECRLETGRTHQIRVHALSQGFPLVGDDKYGDFDFNREVSRGLLGAPLKRMFLHAARLRFTHPVTGEQLDIQAPMPEDCAALLKVLDEKGGR